MSKVGTILAVGGVSTVIFALAFVAVAKARGAAIGEMPPLSWFVAQPAVDPHAAPAVEHPAATPRPAEREIAPAVAPMTAGVLGAFVLPSPFDSRELQELQRELVDRRAKVEATEQELARRAAELDDWQRTLEARQRELDEVRARIESGVAPDAPAPASPAEAARDTASWRAMAPLFEEGDVEDLAAKLATFEPDEAAQVLQALEPERAAALLNALPEPRYRPVLDAWRRARDAR